MYAVLVGSSRCELVDAGTPQEAARLGVNRCSVLQIRHGVDVKVYEVAELEVWRFQYERPDARLFPKPGEVDLGEIVGVRVDAGAGPVPDRLAPREWRPPASTEARQVSVAEPAP